MVTSEKKNTFGLFDAAAELMQSFADKPVEHFGAERFIEVFGKPIYARTSQYPSCLADREDQKKVHNLISGAGIFPFVRSLPESEFEHIKNNNTSLSGLESDALGVDLAVFHSDSQRALSIMRPASIAAKIRETKSLLLGGEIGKEWHELGVDNAHRIGLKYDTSNPTLVKIVQFVPNDMIQDMLDIVGKHHKEMLASLEMKNGATAVFVQRSALERIREVEKVPNVAVGGPGGQKL